MEGALTVWTRRPESLLISAMTLLIQRASAMIGFLQSSKIGKEKSGWVRKDGGLNCLDPKTGNITRYRHNPNDTNSLSHDEVRALYEDRQGTIWVGTGFPYTGDAKWKKGGLNRFNRVDKNFTRFLHDPKDQSSLIDNRIWTIYEDSKGSFWVGTAGDGLHTMNREKGTFERHQYNAANPNGLSRPPVRNTIPWADDFITFIREDVSGTFWIGTFSGGLNNYDPETRKLNYYASLKENSTDKNQVAERCLELHFKRWSALGFWLGRCFSHWIHYTNRYPTMISANL